MGSSCLESTRILHVLLIFAGFSPSTCLQPGENTTATDLRRPIYNIAHMVNSIPEIQSFLDRGANAIECDVYFDQDGNAKSVVHGSPCDCDRDCNGKEDLSTYLNHIREITTPGNPLFSPKLVFVFLDLKVSTLRAEVKAHAGESLASQVLQHLWTPGLPQSQINVLFSIGHIHDVDVITSLQNALEDNLTRSFMNTKIGFDIGLNDKIQVIDSAWNRLNVSGNVWLGDGLTNCLIEYTLDNRLREALRERDDNQRFSKVYRWSVDNELMLTSTLRMGVDGIITNYPERLQKILEGRRMSKHFRLATIDDNPWETSVIENSTSLLPFALKNPNKSFLRYLGSIIKNNFSK